MSKNNLNCCTAKTKVIFIVITLCFIGFAFVNSSMPAYESAEESGNVLSFLQDFFNGLGLKAELTDYIVRKSAHFSEYSAIGAMLMLCAFSFNKERPYKYYINVMFCGLLTAVVDETIQLNVKGRAGMVEDVLLDFVGIIAGTIFMFIIFAIRRLILKSKHKNEKQKN